MPTVHRQQSWKVQIFANDHAPPHVHLVSAEHKIVAEIATGQVLKGSEASVRALAEGLAWVLGHRERLLAEWNRIVEREHE